jgi:hypothetical protein
MERRWRRRWVSRTDREVQDCGIWDSCQVNEDRSSADGKQRDVLIAEVAAFLTCSHWGSSRHLVRRTRVWRGRERERVVEERVAIWRSAASTRITCSTVGGGGREKEGSGIGPMARMLHSVSDVSQVAWLDAKFRGWHPSARLGHDAQRARIVAGQV